MRGGGSAKIDTAHPSNGRGSLHFITTGADDKADLVKSLGLAADRTLGNISSLSYSYYRSAGSMTEAYLAPALRLAFYDAPTQKSGYLIYEPTYQAPGNASVPTGTFIDANLLGGNFWMREFGGSGTIERYDVTLAQWASGTQQAPGASVLNANTYIYAIELGVGSGWSGTFDGAVDNVNIGFGVNRIAANLEPVASATAAVPEPATWAMMLVGFGIVGFGLRRRHPSRGAARVALA